MTMNSQRAFIIKPQAASTRSIAAQRDSTLLRGFTLVELLVVMGIIAVLGILTTLGYRGIAKDAKLASGKNTVAAVLDNARGLAMKNNRIVMVVFRPRLDGPHEQYTEALLCEWTGESAITPDGIVDRYVAMDGVAPRALPKGIKVAGPRYGEAGNSAADQYFDYVWATQTQLTKIDPSNGTGEIPGELVAVMYAPDGTVVTRNPRTDSNFAFVDYNKDGLQREYTSATTFIDHDFVSSFPGFYFEQRFEHDETFVNLAPFIAVYDDDEARELASGNWTTQNGYAELIGSPIASAASLGYISNNADRIHFNRYTGVVMK